MSNSEAIITSSSLSQLLFELKHIELKISNLRSPPREKSLAPPPQKVRHEREREPALLLVIARDKKRVGGRVVVLERGVVR